MSEENQKNLKSKFGSSLLAGAQGMANSSKEDAAPRRTPQIKISKSAYTNMLSVKILKGLGLGILVIFLVYLAFAATIIRVIPSTSAGMVPVKNITFEGGNVPAGEKVVMSMNKTQGTGIIDYLNQALVPQTDVSVMGVLAGPWDTFGWADPGIIAIDGEIVEGVTMDEPETKTLNGEYLGVCLEGACTPGKAYVFSSDNIMGSPLGGKK